MLDTTSTTTTSSSSVGTTSAVPKSDPNLSVAAVPAVSLSTPAPKLDPKATNGKDSRDIPASSANTPSPKPSSPSAAAKEEEEEKKRKLEQSKVKQAGEKSNLKDIWGAVKGIGKAFITDFLDVSEEKQQKFLDKINSAPVIKQARSIVNDGILKSAVKLAIWSYRKLTAEPKNVPKPTPETKKKVDDSNQAESTASKTSTSATPSSSHSRIMALSPRPPRSSSSEESETHAKTPSSPADRREALGLIINEVNKHQNIRFDREINNSLPSNEPIELTTSTGGKIKIIPSSTTEYDCKIEYSNNEEARVLAEQLQKAAVNEGGNVVLAAAPAPVDTPTSTSNGPSPVASTTPAVSMSPGR